MTKQFCYACSLNVRSGYPDSLCFEHASKRLRDLCQWQSEMLERFRFHLTDKTATPFGEEDRKNDLLADLEKGPQ